MFTSGATVLAAELSASRLLAPAFGTSLPVWAAIIGLMLLYLAVGYFVGGRLADRHPRPALFYGGVAVAAALLAVVPMIATPVVSLARSAFSSGAFGVLLSSFGALLALFAVPVSLLGMVSPFALRLSVDSVERTGAVAGQLYGLSTIGSLLGAFLPVLWLIPSIGTRATFLAFALPLLALAATGLAVHGRRKAAIAGVLAGLALLALGLWLPEGDGDALYEGESAHNHIRVIEKHGVVELRLNEGVAVDAIYRRDRRLRGSIWDRMVLAPLAVPGFDGVERLAVLGGGPGTLARSYGDHYGSVPIDLVEIDADLLALGPRFFDLHDEQVEAHVADARGFLQDTDRTYDVVVMDAYKVPYMPFHLATVEFFRLVDEHLAPDGVFAVNILGLSGDRELLEAVGSTLDEVFPHVLELHSSPPPTSTKRGVLLLASRAPISAEAYRANLVALPRSPLRTFATGYRDCIVPFEGEGPVMTDDLSPIEHLVHAELARAASR